MLRLAATVNAITRTGSEAEMKRVNDLIRAERLRNAKIDRITALVGQVVDCQMILDSNTIRMSYKNPGLAADYMTFMTGAEVPRDAADNTLMFAQYECEFLDTQHKLLASITNSLALIEQEDFTKLHPTGLTLGVMAVHGMTCIRAPTVKLFELNDHVMLLGKNDTDVSAVAWGYGETATYGNDKKGLVHSSNDPNVGYIAPTFTVPVAPAPPAPIPNNTIVPPTVDTSDREAYYAPPVPPDLNFLPEVMTTKNTFQTAVNYVPPNPVPHNFIVSGEPTSPFVQGAVVFSTIPNNKVKQRSVNFSLNNFKKFTTFLKALEDGNDTQITTARRELIDIAQFRDDTYAYSFSNKKVYPCEGLVTVGVPGTSNSFDVNETIGLYVSSFYITVKQHVEEGITYFKTINYNALNDDFKKIYSSRMIYFTALTVFEYTSK